MSFHYQTGNTCDESKVIQKSQEKSVLYSFKSINL